MEISLFFCQDNPPFYASVNSITFSLSILVAGIFLSFHKIF